MSNFIFGANWFLPGNTPYPGQLNVDEKDGKIILEIYSSKTIEGYQNSVTQNPAEYFHQYIFGDGFGGPFTLYNCHLAGANSIGKDFYKSTYKIEFLIYGVQVNPSAELMVKSGKFLFPGLADWYDGWHHTQVLSNIEGKLTDLYLSKSEKLKISDDLELIFYDTVNSRIEQISFSYLISYNKSVTFNYSDDVPFSRLLQDSVTFLKLLEFSNSKPLNRMIAGLEISHTHVTNKPAYHRAENLTKYYRISNFSLSKNKEIPKHGSVAVHMVFNHDKLGSKEELNKLIIKWFSQQTFNNIIEYYLDANNWFQGSKGALLSNVMFNNRFLNLIQGLEDYYREKHYNNNDEVQFNLNKAAAMKRIIDPVLKHWLNDTFKFSVHLSLAEKLKIIVAECMPDLIAIYGSVSFDNFPRAAADFRNTLSHGMNKEINLGDKLHLHYQIARFLLLICILKSLGIKDIKRLLDHHFSLGRNMQQIIRLQKIYPA